MDARAKEGSAATANWGLVAELEVGLVVVMVEKVLGGGQVAGHGRDGGVGVLVVEQW